MEKEKREQPNWVKKIISELNKEEPEGPSRETDETDRDSL
jgi:hypothetical protein